jgi:hypothetical protein
MTTVYAKVVKLAVPVIKAGNCAAEVDALARALLRRGSERSSGSTSWRPKATRSSSGKLLEPRAKGQLDEASRRRSRELTDLTPGDSESVKVTNVLFFTGYNLILVIPIKPVVL